MTTENEETQASAESADNSADPRGSYLPLARHFAERAALVAALRTPQDEPQQPD